VASLVGSDDFLPGLIVPDGDEHDGSTSEEIGLDGDSTDRLPPLLRVFIDERLDLDARPFRHGQAGKAMSTSTVNDDGSHHRTSVSATSDCEAFASRLAWHSRQMPHLNDTSSAAQPPPLFSTPPNGDVTNIFQQSSHAHIM
jgi:hypothetical protein